MDTGGITVETSDKMLFYLPENILNKFPIFSDMRECNIPDNDQPVSLQHIDGNTFQFLLEFNDNDSDAIHKLNPDDVIQILVAADFLQMEGLIEVLLDACIRIIRDLDQKGVDDFLSGRKLH